MPVSQLGLHWWYHWLPVPLLVLHAVCHYLEYLDTFHFILMSTHIKVLPLILTMTFESNTHIRGSSSRLGITWHYWYIVLSQCRAPATQDFSPTTAMTRFSLVSFLFSQGPGQLKRGTVYTMTTYSPSLLIFQVISKNGSLFLSLFTLRMSTCHFQVLF